MGCPAFWHGNMEMQSTNVLDMHSQLSWDVCGPWTAGSSCLLVIALLDCVCVCVCMGNSMPVVQESELHEAIHCLVLIMSKL